MAENEKVMSNREKLAGRLREKYPDKEYADDEALYGQVNADYDDFDKEISRHREQEKSLTDLFTSDPRSAAFLQDWTAGENPVIALVRRFGDDFTEALKDPANAEALAAAHKEYAERVAKNDEYERQYRENMRETLSTLDAMQEEEGLSDADIDRAMEYLFGVMRDGVSGKFTAASVRMALKALDHDADVETAGREGEVRGRNTRIEERLRRRGRGDGTASIGGRNAGGGVPGRMPELGAIDRDYGSMNIYERGGERRRPAR